MLLSLNGIHGTAPVNYLNSQPATFQPPALALLSDYKAANLSRLNGAGALARRLEINDEASLLKMVKLPLLPTALFSGRYPDSRSFAQSLTENISNNSNEVASSRAAPLQNASTRRQTVTDEPSNEISNESSSESSSSSSESSSARRRGEFNRLDNENESSPKNEFNKFYYSDSSAANDVPRTDSASSSTNRPNSRTSNGFANGSNQFNDDYVNSVRSIPDDSSVVGLNSNSPALLSTAQLDVTASEPISSPPLTPLSSTLTNESSFLSSSTFSTSSTSQKPISPTEPRSTQPIALLISSSKPLTDLLNSTKLPIKSILATKNNETMQKSLNSTLSAVSGAVGNTIAYEYPPYIRNTATVIFIIILIFGTIGNILVSVIIIRSKDLRNTTNYFLINLSIADLLVIIVCMPTVLIELHSQPEIWLLGEFMCKTIPYLEMSVAHASILTMMAISFERFYAICKPLKVSYKCTKLRAVLIILGVWVIALLATLPLLFIAKQSSANYLDGSEVQVCLTQANDNWSKAFFLIIITLFFFLPLCVLVIIYVAITKRLCAKENISYAESVQMRARRQVVIMLATVIICFFICLLPFRLFTLFLLFSSSQTLETLGMERFYVVLYTSRVMLYLNSALNPLLYNIVSSKFRNAFVQILCCRTLSGINSRMLIRQSTFNTTTTTMSLTANSALNGFLNSSLVNFGGSDANKYKRNSMQNCSLKQSYSVDTSLRQLNFKRSGRQASLQQFSNSSGAVGLFDRDENDNKISLTEPSDGRSNKIDRCNLFRDKRLIKQTNFAPNEENNENDENSENNENVENDQDMDEPTDRIGNCSLNDKLENTSDRSIKAADKSSDGLSDRAEQQADSRKPNANKKYSLKYSTVTAELKVATLEEDLSSINSANSPIELDGKKGRGKRRLNLRLLHSIGQRLFDRAGARRNRANRARLITMNDKSNREIAKESITDELCTGERSRESNV